MPSLLVTLNLELQKYRQAGDPNAFRLALIRTLLPRFRMLPSTI